MPEATRMFYQYEYRNDMELQACWSSAVFELLVSVRKVLLIPIAQLPKSAVLEFGASIMPKQAFRIMCVLPCTSHLATHVPMQACVAWTRMNCYVCERLI